MKRSGTMRRKKKGRTILSSMLATMIIVLFIQTILFIAAIFLGGAFKNLDNSSFEIFQEIAMYRRNILEKEFVNHWMNIDSTYKEVVIKVDDIIESNGKTYDNLLSKETALNTEVINSISDSILKTINTNVVTGAFVMFGNDSETDKYGIYFRDTNMGMILDNYSDIKIEIAPSGFSNSYHLIESSWLNRQFKYNQFSVQDRRVLTNPINAKIGYGNIDYSDCGWWSTPYILNDPDTPVITYSVPLISSSGIIYGVFGIELSVTYLCSLMPSEELDSGNNGFYVLAREENGEIVEKHTLVSSYYSTAQKNPTEISNILAVSSAQFASTAYTDIFKVHANESSYYLTRNPLKIYNNNAPFSDEKWVVIGVVTAEFIHEFSLRLQMTIFFTILLSVIIAITIIVTLAYFITSPIARLTNQVKSTEFARDLRLSKINIKEIDELTDAIDNLNETVIDSETKLSKIIDLVNLPIVAFEYNHDANTFYTSKNISEFLLFDNKEITTIEGFLELLNALAANQIKDDATIYKYVDTQGANRWVEIRDIEREQKNAKMGIFVDVTVEYSEKENLLYERNMDSLTNIFNRRAFLDEISIVFNTPEKIKKGALIMIDLDDLKFINDNYGHDYGDEYIKKTAEIITTACGKTGNRICGRRSGDEFYIFLYGYNDFMSIDIEINKLQNAFINSKTMAPDGTIHHVRASTGVSIYPDDGTNYHELIKYADYAMYEIKNSLKGEFKYFDRSSYEQNAYLLHNKEELNNLIENELVDFHFQPIVDIKKGSIMGYEALMRSLLASFSGPNEILNVARSQFKLNRIERLTFMKTLEKYTNNADLFKKRKMFINSIANQKITDDDINFVEEKYGMYLDRIVIEFTEHEKSVKVITEQKCNLVARWSGQIALDDYGTGFNGEVSLLESKPDYVKIDISLVRNINMDTDRQQMVNNIINYAKKKGIKTIAEGVEVVEELETLIALGCDYVQGYLLSRPTPLPCELPEEKVNLILELNKKIYGKQ